MMTSTLVRRIVALSILLGVVLLGWIALAAPLLAIPFDRQAEIQTLSSQLAHYRALVARKPVLRQRATDFDAMLAPVGSFWTGSSPAVIGAAIQDALRGEIAEGGGRIRSTADAGQTDDHGLTRIAVRFNVDGSIITLHRILQAIESAKPSLFVDRMVITTVETALGQDRAPMLQLDIVVAGYVRPPAISSKSVLGQ